MKNSKKYLSKVTGALLTSILIFGYGCSSSDNKAEEANQDNEVLEETVVEEDNIMERDVFIADSYMVVDEEIIVGVDMTPEAAPAKPKPKASASEAKTNADSEEDIIVEEDVITMEAIDLALAEEEYIAETTFDVTETVIPLDETQTVVSYGKKGEPQAAFQVTSDPNTGEVEQVVFVNKKHKDVYNVQAGMSGKEVKKLRKELKHMVKKGQVFLYDDNSNIMYLMDAENMVGDEVTASDVENMDVQAVVWKHKKHHKKNKNK
jgi:hypothetical protein